MATGQNECVLRQLGTLLELGTAAELTDGQLLERFCTRSGDHAEQAFASLVERHGPMVLRVCTSVLGNHSDVEDAFQGTFLVLVKKARSLWVTDSLGPWLHQVALRTASAARSARARRHKHERLIAISVDSRDGDRHDDLAHVLHEEIDRLPDRFRMSVILCDLEGRTHEQAAGHLGWPVGTVKSRLTRARERLRDRLIRRGMAPGASVVPFLRSASMESLLPAGLVQSTVRSAVRFAAARTVLEGSAAILAQGVLTAMSMNRWWKAASLVLVAGATASSAGLLAAGNGVVSGAARPQDVGKVTAASPEGDIPVARVKIGQVQVAVEQGTLESSQRKDVFSRLESWASIVSIVPEGTRVKKGDLVCELDSASLRDTLVKQRLATQSSRTAYENARLTREVAEIAVKEYEEGIYPQECQAIQGEIKGAQEEIRQTESRLERTRKAQQKLKEMLGRTGIRQSSDIISELDLEDRISAVNLVLSRERFVLEAAQAKLRVLTDYTKPKTVKEAQVRA